MKPGKRRGLDKAGPEAAAERRKASVRAKVEHPFLYVKRYFGYAKVRYRGLAKNTQRIAVLLGFTNLLIAGRDATAWRGGSPSATAARRRGRSARASKSPFPGTTTRPRWALAFHPRATTPVYPENGVVQTSPNGLADIVLQKEFAAGYVLRNDVIALAVRQAVFPNEDST